MCTQTLSCNSGDNARKERRSRASKNLSLEDPISRVNWSSEWGGPHVACQILKTAMSHVNVAKKIALSPVTNHKYPCPMSLTILGPMSHVEFKKYPCCMSHRCPCRMSNLRKAPVAVTNLRNGHVALSILVVNPH